MDEPARTACEGDTCARPESPSSAKEVRDRAEERERLTRDVDLGFPQGVVDESYWGGYKRGEAERERLNEAARRREKEAKDADAKAAELEAAAEQATMRAARGG